VSDQVRRYLVDALAGVTTDGTGRAPFDGFPLDQIPVATKTGTGEVAGKQTTSWFASFAPADDPQYAVVMMVSQGGTGSGTSGRSVRAIYEALYGVTGSTVNPANAIFPTGAPPTALPTIRTDGTVLGAEGNATAPTAPVAPSTTPTPTAAPRRRPDRRRTP
jgi:penicillin-binding protein 2